MYRLNIKKIGLITPYTGGNLGDGAIQDAVIQAINKKNKKATIKLITLLPSATTKLHGIPSFPVTRSAMNSNIVTQCQENNCKNNKKNENIDKIISRSIITLKLIFKEVKHIILAYRFMKDIELLIVSGGGQVDDYWGGAWGHPYALFKWGLIAKIVGSRYIFLSVGYCSLKSTLSRLFVRGALSLADYRSYRDNDSKTLLNYLKFTKHDCVYPDLAFSYNLNREHSNIRRDCQDIITVAVSPIAYLSKHWPTEDSAIFRNYMKVLTDFIRNLIKLNYNIVLIATDGADVNLIAEIQRRSCFNFNELKTGKLKFCKTDTVKKLLDSLKLVDYVVASRLHCIILSHIINLPTLAISYDRKVDTYMRDIGLSEYCIDIHNLNVSCLNEKFKAITLNADNIRKIAEKKIENYRCELKRQYEYLFEKFIS